MFVDVFGFSLFELSDLLVLQQRHFLEAVRDSSACFSFPLEKKEKCNQKNVI